MTGTCDTTKLDKEVSTKIIKDAIEESQKDSYVPEVSDYNSNAKKMRNECKYTEPNLDISPGNVLVENLEYTFCKEAVEEEKEELEITKDKFLYASECVQILDQIPFHSEDNDDEDIHYYDSLINT